MNHLLTIDKLKVSIFDTREEMGARAAGDIALAINETLSKKGECNMIFAAAPSQNEVLASLRTQAVDWTRVNAFHMDEYENLADDAPQGFFNFLNDRLFSLLPFKSVHRLRDIDSYTRELAAYPVDITVMGIGENGHIAFNDPHEADFRDPAAVKRVTLDETCRMQQVHDGCFQTLDDVPRTALTLTVPALMRAKAVFCIVPAASKARAVEKTLLGPIGESCPASILRTHDCPALYLDKQSAARL